MPDLTPNSGNADCNDESLELSFSEDEEDKTDPWEYLDANCPTFIPKLLLFTIQKPRFSTFRFKVVNILSEYFQIPNELKYLNGAFSDEGVRLLECLFRSDKPYLIVDAFRFFLMMFRTHKDTFLYNIKTSIVFYDVLRLLWNKNFFGDVCNLLRVFIQLGSRFDVVHVFRSFEILEKLCESAKIKIARNNTHRVQELEILELFRRKMIIHNNEGYLMWIRVAREYGFE